MKIRCGFIPTFSTFVMIEAIVHTMCKWYYFTWYYNEQCIAWINVSVHYIAKETAFYATNQISNWSAPHCLWLVTSPFTKYWYQIWSDRLLLNLAFFYRVLIYLTKKDLATLSGNWQDRQLTIRCKIKTSFEKFKEKKWKKWQKRKNSTASKISMYLVIACCFLQVLLVHTM